MEQYQQIHRVDWYTFNSSGTLRGRRRGAIIKRKQIPLYQSTHLNPHAHCPDLECSVRTHGPHAHPGWKDMEAQRNALGCTPGTQQNRNLPKVRWWASHEMETVIRQPTPWIAWIGWEASSQPDVVGWLCHITWDTATLGVIENVHWADITLVEWCHRSRYAPWWASCCSCAQ